MKTLVRTFFRTLRTVLGPFMLLKERLTQPTGVQRAPAAQAAGSGATKVPCLKITDSQGQAVWLQDSAAIVAYLRAHFGR